MQPRAELMASSEYISFMPVDHYQSEQLRGDVSRSVPELKGRLRDFFSLSEATLFSQGRVGLTNLLVHLGMSRKDELYITTTYDYPCVSSHVTSTVFNICKPSRVLTDATRAILVIHEFGVAHPNINKLLAIAAEGDLAVIEDCAHTFLSRTPEGRAVGTMGDWTLLSFPKYWPVVWGGAIIGPEPVKRENGSVARNRIEQSVDRIAETWNRIGDWAHDRVNLHGQLSELVQPLGLKPGAPAGSDSIPWFFPAAVPDPERLLLRAGEEKIDCARWYGTNLVVLPMHQFLAAAHLQRIRDMLARHLDECEHETTKP